MYSSVLPYPFFSFANPSADFNSLGPEFLSDCIFESFGIRKFLILTVSQQMADSDASKIWYYKYCKDISITGIEADVD